MVDFPRSSGRFDLFCQSLNLPYCSYLGICIVKSTQLFGLLCFCLFCPSWERNNSWKMGQIIHFNYEKIDTNDKHVHARGSMWHRSTVRLDGPAGCGKIRLGWQWCWLQCHNLVRCNSNWGWVERIFIWYCSGTVAKTVATNLTGAMRHSQQHWPSSVWLVFELFKRYVQEIKIRLMEHGAGADYRSAHVRNF